MESLLCLAPESARLFSVRVIRDQLTDRSLVRNVTPWSAKHETLVLDVDWTGVRRFRTRLRN